MTNNRRILVLVLCFCLVSEQAGFAQSVTALDLPGRAASFFPSSSCDEFRPIHLRSLAYDAQADNFRLLLDNGDRGRGAGPAAEAGAEELMKYFLIGLSLPNDMFWVNLRPDAQDAVIDAELARTEVGRVFLEADVQLKKDTAAFTSPRTREGKAYWDKLYKKAEELFGLERIVIPTMARPWIVPGEIIIAESGARAYIYKATLKVRLEQDRLKTAAGGVRDDPRLEALNEYSAELLRGLILPRLVREVNSARRYAGLRQVYYSLIFAQWFKSRFGRGGEICGRKIDGKDLSGLTSARRWSKDDYFADYRRSFREGEYAVSQRVSGASGQAVRNYFSGGCTCLVPFPPAALSGTDVEAVTGDTRVVVLGGDAALRVFPPSDTAGETMRVYPSQAAASSAVTGADEGMSSAMKDGGMPGIAVPGIGVGPVPEKDKGNLLAYVVLYRLMGQLRDRNGDVRKEIVRTMAEIAKEQSILAREIMLRLYERMSDPDRDIRMAACEAVGEISLVRKELLTKEITVRLAMRLDEEDIDVRRAAILAMENVAVARPEHIDAAVIRQVTDRLNDPDEQIRVATGRVLGWIAKGHPALHSLFGELEAGNAQRREAAAHSVGETAGLRPEMISVALVERLVGKLRDDDPLVRQAVAWSLGAIAGARLDLARGIADSLYGLLGADSPHASHAAVVAMGAVAAAAPAVVTREITDRLFEQLSDRDRSQSVVHTVGVIAGSRPELITDEEARELFGALDDRDSDVRRTTAAAMRDIARARPGLAGEIADRLVKRLDDPDQDVRRAVMEAVGVAAGVRPEAITPGIWRAVVMKLDDAGWAAGALWQELCTTAATIVRARTELVSFIEVERMIEKLHDPLSETRAQACRLVGVVAAVKPESARLVMGALLEKTGDSIENVRREVSKAIGAAAADPQAAETARDFLLHRASADGEWGALQCAVWALGEVFRAQKSESREARDFIYARMDDQHAGVRLAAVESLGAFITGAGGESAKMTQCLLAKLNDEDWRVRRAAVGALEDTVISDLANSGEAVRRLLERLSDQDWRVRQTAVQILGDGIAVSGIDFEGVERWKKELLDPSGLFWLKEENLIAGYTVLACFPTAEDLNRLAGFADRTREVFRRLVDLVGSNIEFGNMEQVLEILGSQVDIAEANRLCEDAFVKRLNLNVYAPTRSWNKLESWLDACSQWPVLAPKFLPHIIVTMRLLQQGVGADAGFRAGANVEHRIPQVRAELIRVLERVHDPLSRKRLVKAMAVGSVDQIDLLRNQSVELVQAALGGDIDSRRGVVGDIRENIHNRPSPQDLAEAKAYLRFVETGSADDLRRLGHEPAESDRVPEQRKEQVIAAARSLIATLEEVYGEGSVAMIAEYARDWSEHIEGHGELKEELSGLLNTPPADSFSFMNRIIRIRTSLAVMNRDLIGDRLLLSVGLDNRLEVLYYRKFNEVKDKLDYHNPRVSFAAIINLLENTRLNGYQAEEIGIITGELNALREIKDFGRNDWLRLYSIYKRIERLIGAASAQALDEFQEIAERVGRAIGAGDSFWVNNFSANIFRSDTVYLLSLALSEAKKAAIAEAGISGWQIVVPGVMQGRVKRVKSTAGLAGAGPEDIIVIDSLPSETPPITDVAGIITFNEDGLLSHPAIRARQYDIPFAVCPDASLLAGLDGAWITLDARDEDTVALAREGAEARGGPTARAVGEKWIPLIKADMSDRDFIIPTERYRPELVGNKAYRLGSIPGDLLENQVVPRHFALSFSFFPWVLGREENSSSRTRLEQLMRMVVNYPSAEYVPEKLRQMRQLISELAIPEEMLAAIEQRAQESFGQGARLFVRSTTNAEDLPGYQAAGLYDSFGNVRAVKEELGKYIKEVWASIWSERAFFDRRANGIAHNSVYPAVLVQEMILPEYAFVVHTRNPANPGKDELVIELVQGFGESLVSGSQEYAGSPYRFLYDRSSGRIRLVSFANKSRKVAVDNGVLRPVAVSYKDDALFPELVPVISAVAGAALRIEKMVGQPQDIEGAIVSNHGKPGAVFFQSRNQETTAGTDTAGASDGGSPEGGKGGIDLRALPSVYRVIGPRSARFWPHLAAARGGSDAEEEWLKMQRMVNAGIVPSADRVMDYAACCYREKSLAAAAPRLLRCIAGVLRAQEAEAADTGLELREMLMAVERLR